MYVNGEANFVGVITANNLYVSGILTATSINIQDSGGNILAGIITTGNLKVGTGLTTLQSSLYGIGIGTAAARAKLDIEGHTRLKSYSENVSTLTTSGGDVSVDLSAAQSFTLTTDQTVNAFRLQNIPDDASSFTIRVDQGSSVYTVDLDKIHVGAGASCIVKWPGGIVPTVTQSANKTDIYSFKIFDGATLKSTPSTSVIYGIVGGQNFV